jgi:hypothetical protein
MGQQEEANRTPTIEELAEVQERTLDVLMLLTSLLAGRGVLPLREFEDALRQGIGSYRQRRKAFIASLPDSEAAQYEPVSANDEDAMVYGPMLASVRELRRD